MGSEMCIRDREMRCAFLNEENLCDLYAALGKKSLCKTCRLYPRHIEEFEGVREISLSVSCPEVARILMEKKEPVVFRAYEKEGEEEYEEFDLFLYSMLVDAREAMIQILQNRRYPIAVRVGMILGMGHDIQVRINREEMFSCMEVIERYQSERAWKFVEKHPLKIEFAKAKKLFRRLYKLELLKEDWDMLLKEADVLLYGNGSETYMKIEQDFRKWQQDSLPDMEIQMEQLLVYFIFTYFCGAVYDGEADAKVKMASACVFQIRELWKARWIKNMKELDISDIIEIVYRFSREVEHSDINLRRIMV